MENKHKFTEEDLDAVWGYYKDYFLEVLNGEYAIEDARNDLLSLIGSKWDQREGRENKNIETNP